MRGLWALVLLIGCEPARDLGLETELRFEGALYVRGAPPEPSGGPEVLSLETSRNVIRPGERGHPIRGTLSGAAESALLSAGDGYWIVVAGAPDAFAPDARVFDARAELAHEAPEGPLGVDARAVDAQGRVGHARTLELHVMAEPIDDAELSIALDWDGDADLDLRVIDPSGVEISVRNPSAWTPPLPGQAPDPEGPARAASLDVDVQAGCTRGHPRRERIRWPIAPSPGRYLVKVDTFSMCEAQIAYWQLTASRLGAVLARSQGVSLPSDTRFAHDRGAGLLAMELTIP